MSLSVFQGLATLEHYELRMKWSLEFLDQQVHTKALRLEFPKRRWTLAGISKAKSSNKKKNNSTSTKPTN